MGGFSFASSRKWLRAASVENSDFAIITRHQLSGQHPANKDSPDWPDFFSKDTLRLLAQGQGAKYGLLFRDEGLHALPGEGDHSCQLLFVEDLVLGGGLDVD